MTRESTRNQSGELDQLAAALCAAQAEFTAIPKDSTNPFFKSAYAGLPKVVEVASPILTKHGLAVTQFIGADEQGDTLTTWLLHKSGQYICEAMRLHLAKQDPQGQGSATTYARRYSYMAVLGLVADEDDDANKASQPARSTQANGGAVSARPAQTTERQASGKQRGLINGKASEKGLDPAHLANIVLAATESEVRDFDSPEDAEAWLRRAMDRLPARLVDPILAGIEKADPEEVAF